MGGLAAEHPPARLAGGQQGVTSWSTPAGVRARSTRRSRTQMDVNERGATTYKRGLPPIPTSSDVGGRADGRQAVARPAGDARHRPDADSYVPGRCQRRLCRSAAQGRRNLSDRN